ncbi:MAG: HEAT repeat domain-containing protein [Tepidisphaerales bacterium]
MLGELIEALVQSSNEAADDCLLDALRLGSDREKALALNALLRRRTVRGLSGVVAGCFSLPLPLQDKVVQNIKLLHHALRESARSGDRDKASAAMKLISLGRQGKLTYLLTEGLHGVDEAVARTAVESMVSLARWVSSQTRALATRQWIEENPADVEERTRLYTQLTDERPEIEQAVARAIDVHRGRYGAELLLAALLLADWPDSRTLAILTTPKHGGQTAMVRRLQQPPESDYVDAFLLSASHGHVRATFGVAFAHIVDPPVLDGLLLRTHWLKDQRLQVCMRQVSRGVWCGEEDLGRELSRRDSRDLARIAEWIGVSGLHDVVQDQKLERIRLQLGNDAGGRLMLLRVAMSRGRGGSVDLLRTLIVDPDERLARMAAREIVRRRPPEFENLLMQLMSAGVHDSVRRLIGRSVGKVGFDTYWHRYDRLDRSTRRTAGRAMLKLVPGAVGMLERRLRTGPIDQRLKAVSMTQDLGVAEQVADTLLALCVDANSRVRSKSVMLLAQLPSISPDQVLERVLNDEDPRVRANAIEVLETRQRVEFVPMLTQRAMTSSSRERANAIRALHRMKVGTASQQLVNMLQDERPDHRISALWALRQIGWWQLINEVGRLAKTDTNLRVRRYAMSVLRGVSEMLGERATRAS